MQKLSYLRGQLQGDAARIIASFQLTNANYEPSVDLLKERFGQQYKQVDAHLQALVDLRSPTATLTSLHEFNDSVEGHIRSLASLGNSEERYDGAMLVRIIWDKIPAKIKQNLARAHGRQEWKIHELQKAILNEIYILEGGSQADSSTPPPNYFIPYWG